MEIGRVIIIAGGNHTSVTTKREGILVARCDGEHRPLYSRITC